MSISEGPQFSQIKIIQNLPKMSFTTIVLAILALFQFPNLLLYILSAVGIFSIGCLTFIYFNFSNKNYHLAKNVVTCAVDILTTVDEKNVSVFNKPIEIETINEIIQTITKEDSLAKPEKRNSEDKEIISEDNEEEKREKHAIKRTKKAKENFMVYSSNSEYRKLEGCDY